ncbi:MAG: Unknown protein [uncultured Sulfurovum sp.]|uniref:Tyr recombinase domain-containing protein n=1 Tax=uncultured Sulfurovum sp. TaxID=269237 RepID=A0A6S6SPZ2_9BACT|nr:MAG: Unknown protein [uncultured Sulfurovum sp.]
MSKKIERIKENVTIKEYKKLMSFTKEHESLRDNSKLNLLRAFTILFYTGLRVNELQALRIGDIKELIKNRSVKVELDKTSTERKLYLSNDFEKALLELFDLNEDDENRVIAKGANKNKKSGIHPITFITHINKIMKESLGTGFTSHSFRQGLISEMGSKSVNVKIISKFIGHRDVKTTLGYIKPTDSDISQSLVR